MPRGLYTAAAALTSGFLVVGGMVAQATRITPERAETGGTAIAYSPESSLRPSTTTTTVTTTTTTTTDPPPTTTKPLVPTTVPRPVAAALPRQSPPAASTFGCAAALAYLAAHANPEARFECPGWAEGHQAETCWRDPPTCGANDFVIRIWVPCPAAYMNEAWNSNHLDGPYDPYGHC
jgi:hypothetical protein